MSNNILQGITSGKLQGFPQNETDEMLAAINPPPHAPVRCHDRVQIEVVGPDGQVKQRVDKLGNILTTYGLDRLCQMVATGTAASSTWVSAMRIGTDATAAASTDTSCLSSVASISAGASFSLSNRGARTFGVLATFASNNPAGTATIQEVCIHANTTGNNQGIARAVLSPIVNKGASDVIQITYDIIFTTAP